MEAALYEGTQLDTSVDRGGGHGNRQSMAEAPWWNSGAPHMNQALPKKLWDRLGLVSILDTINRLSRIALTAVYGTVRTVL